MKHLEAARQRGICEETYQDALKWDQARIDREVRGICDYLSENSALMSKQNIEVLAHELRAIQTARQTLHILSTE